jgi:hypothetical protein
MKIAQTLVGNLLLGRRLILASCELRFELLHQAQRRKELTDLVGEVGIAILVFFERRPLPGSPTPEIVLGQIFHRKTFGLCL